MLTKSSAKESLNTNSSANDKTDLIENTLKKEQPIIDPKDKQKKVIKMNTIVEKMMKIKTEDDLKKPGTEEELQNVISSGIVNLGIFGLWSTR